VAPRQDGAVTEEAVPMSRKCILAAGASEPPAGDRPRPLLMRSELRMGSGGVMEEIMPILQA
jgi:hypothetical protein